MFDETKLQVVTCTIGKLGRVLYFVSRLEIVDNSGVEAENLGELCDLVHT